MPLCNSLLRSGHSRLSNYRNDYTCTLYLLERGYKFLTPTAIGSFEPDIMRADRRGRPRAARAVFFWWVPRCYDRGRRAGRRMTRRNLREYLRLAAV